MSITSQIKLGLTTILSMMILSIVLTLVYQSQSNSSPSYNSFSKTESSLSSTASLCKPISLYPSSIKNFEPSDVAFNSKSNSFFIVSTNTIMNMHINGTFTLHKLPVKDLEACVILESDLDSIYVVHEHPATILKVSLIDFTVEYSLELQPHIDYYPESNSNSKNRGIESIVHLNGLFYIARQSDAKMFSFSIENKIVNWKEVMDTPVTLSDLSAMTSFKDRLYFLYDKAKLLISVDIKQFIDHKLNSKDFKRFVLDRRGFEGIAFGKIDGIEYVVAAVDPPKNKGKKDILLYRLNEFIKCFKE